MDFQKEKILVKTAAAATLMYTVSFEQTAVNTTADTILSEKEALKMEDPSIDNTYLKEDGVGVIYLAGGCFWGMEKLMKTIPGVLRTASGYANGRSKEAPTYEMVCTGTTGYRETVRVEYKKNEISLNAILFAYFSAIDPTIENGQGNDSGSQYQTGVYYTDEESGSIVKYLANIEQARYKTFAVEIKPLESFYEAEEYHQDYLGKNPEGYCHITSAEMQRVSKMLIDPARYKRPSDIQIPYKLTEEQYNVTQKGTTEPPFENKFWDYNERGIYVDIVTGEPLFSSKDKFDSACGWPSFSKEIDPNALVFIKDHSYGMIRTEVRSRIGNSHLGHVFYNDPESPSGTHFCINSASLRFVSYDKMEELEYGYLLKYME